MTGRAAGGSDDIVVVLMDQHESIKEMIAEVQSSAGAVQQEAFDRLREMLAVHETVEELVLRPATRASGGEAVAAARMEEEKAATELLAELESMGVDDPAFTETFARFASDVVRHAQAEEAAEFPLVTANNDLDARERMGRAFLLAQKVAPTHPHPSTAGSTVGVAVAAPFASIVDRVRDALSDRAS